MFLTNNHKPSPVTPEELGGPKARRRPSVRELRKLGLRTAEEAAMEMRGETILVDEDRMRVGFRMCVVSVFSCRRCLRLRSNDITIYMLEFHY